MYILMYAYSCMQNIEETIAKYAVAINLFWLGSTNPRIFFLIFYKKKILNFFLLKSVQICMKDAEYAETNENQSSDFFNFNFLVLVIFNHKYLNHKSIIYAYNEGSHYLPFFGWFSVFLKSCIFLYFLSNGHNIYLAFLFIINHSNYY